MCGRFTLVSDLDLILHRFNLLYANVEYVPRYNIAPSQQVLAVVSDSRERRLGQLRWGLIPFWAKDPKIGYKMINARAETVAEKASFKHSFKRQRCLIPADGFYEWKKEGNRKRPMRVRLKSGEPFAFAGLWSRWTSPEGEEVHSCTILTTRPNSLMKNIHDRMPVILRKEDEDVWLDRTVEDPEFLQQLLEPYDADQMDAYEVSTVVNSPKTDSADCVKPIESV